MLLCLVILQNAELSTSDLLYGELVALQEQLAGWLVDYVVKPRAEYNMLGCDALIVSFLSNIVIYLVHGLFVLF